MINWKYLLHRAEKTQERQLNSKRKTMSKLAESQRATISNEEQLWLMQQVKDKIMTIDEAVSWTESRENELRSMEDDVIPIKVF